MRTIDEILSEIKTKPKASQNSKNGSNYDYVFKCGVYYITLSDIRSLIGGSSVYGCGYESMVNFMQKEYPKLWKEIGELK